MNQKQNEMKSIVENIISSLNKQGIKVSSAAIMDIQDEKNQIAKDIIDKTVSDIMQKFKKDGFAASKSNKATETATGQNIAMSTGGNDFNKKQLEGQEGKEAKTDTKEKCFCPACLNFENFEEVLKEEIGVLDVVPVVLGGRKFTVKYHSGPEGDRIMLAPDDVKVSSVTWTPENLQNALNEAVQNKDFKNAQRFLDELNKLKNNQ